MSITESSSGLAGIFNFEKYIQDKVEMLLNQMEVPPLQTEVSFHEPTQKINMHAIECTDTIRG